MRPRIGISISYDDAEHKYWLNEDYARSIERAGGLPVLLPMVENDWIPDLMTTIDGLLLTGGEDVDPQQFAALPQAKLGKIVPKRDQADLTMAKWAYANQLPVLGICRGIQVMAVAAGQTLIQDIPSEWPGAIKHVQQAPRYYGSHSVTLVRGTLTHSIFNRETLSVNSYHHQALTAVPADFILTAKAPDGMIEGIENPNHPFAVGVQWHPEGMIDQYPEMLLLFEALVTAGRGVRIG